MFSFSSRSSETKMMIVKCAPKFNDSSKLKEEVFVKGAIEKVLPLCTHYIDSSGNYAPMTKDKQKDFMTEAYNIGMMGEDFWNILIFTLFFFSVLLVPSSNRDLNFVTGLLSMKKGG